MDQESEAPVVQNGMANSEKPELPDTATAMSKTTTISTIAVQSGKTRLVIALLHCGDWLQLKILEVTPELTSLGDNLAEALELQKAHDEVLRQLQSKQSPVEELLRQADQLISTQKPRAEVYAAMAESLGRAWKDVNNHLEVRKQILDLNVQYHTRAQEFFDRIDNLEASCADTVVPIEVDAIKKFLTNLHDLRRAVLESLMSALQAGNSILGKLREFGAEGTLDSRPDRIRPSVNRAIAQVQKWLDELHTRRQVLEVTFIRRKTQLEQCLALAILAADLRELEDVVGSRQDMLANTDHLGDSISSAELLQHEHKKILPEAQQLQERALKLTKATEQLVASGCFAGEQATEQAYAILSMTSDYLADLEQRGSLLNRVIAFFKSAQSALTKLDQLEVQLTTTELPLTSPELAQLHAQCSRTIEEITSPPITDGYSILDHAGRGRTGTEGVKRMVEELENRKIFLSGLCTAHHEEKLRINQALNAFLEKQNELYSWLVNIAEAFLQGHQDMGSDLPMAKDFLDLHNQLLNDLQTEGNEINSLLLTLPPILEYLDENQRRDVDSKVEVLHEHWLKLKNMLEKRLDLAAIYVKFHTEADIVNKEMDKLEEQLRRSPGNLPEDTIRSLEDRWESLVPLYQSAKNTGLTFINEANKVSEPYLDTKRACVCVESVLERLSGRQIVVTRNWQSFHTDVVERKELLVQWERNMTESAKTISWVTKLDSQLYPVITTSSIRPRDIASYLEHKLVTVLPDIKRAQGEVEQRIRTAESLIVKSSIVDEQSLNVKNKLIELNQKLVEITTEYQILLQILISYFNNLAELDKTIEKLNDQFRKAGLPNDISDVELLLHEHDASKQAALEMFKFTQNECEQIISRIYKQEPRKAAEHDIEKLQHMLEIRRDQWEEEWRNRRDTLEAHRQLCQFDADLNQINETLDDLSRQLSGVKGQYGESLAAAKATSLAFVYFEKTAELLGQRIDAFVSTGEQLLADQHIHSPHIEHHIQELQDRWRRFKDQVKDTRRLIDLSIQYFQLVDEADEWFKEGSRLLVSIARKTTTVKEPAEAQELLEIVERFLTPGEAKQNERINKISSLAEELYGPEKPIHVSQVVLDNREMINSFTVISSELRTLMLNLKAAEDQRERLKREQDESDAKLAAVQAQAEEARLRAAAEEARRAAEEAKRAAEEARRHAETEAIALKESTLTQKVETIEVTKVQHEMHEVREKSPEKAFEIVEVAEVKPVLEPPLFTTPLSDAVIQEGSKFTFMCQVTGTPVPVVTWCKDGMSIQTNLDYQTTFDQGLCTLTIEETFAEDSARYTCKAINAVGAAETGAFLSVKETEPEEQLIPPSFVKFLEPGLAKEGSKFQFNCKVAGNPLPTVQWFKNNDCIDNSPDYVITYNNGEAILRFEEIFLEDKAEYTCKAANQLGTAQSTASLTVEPLEPTVAPAFVVPLSNVMARAGQKIKLECEVSGLPPPTLTWSHNGKPVKETRELKLQSDGKRATLVISEAFPKDAGTFSVTANNIAGEATSACSVTVKGRLPTETSDSEIASDMEPIKPSIQVPLKDLSTFEGKKVRLDCVIVGQPEPEVIWYRDERPVKESPDFQLLFQGDRCSLVIQEAYAEDAGEYKVVALNSAGEASSKCKLTVTPLTEAELAAKPPEEESKPTGSPPKFSKLLCDILVSENDKVIFEATVTGEPRPDIKWLLNNQDVVANDHIKMSHDDEGNVKLEIEKVLPGDKGVYTVKAINPCGEAKCFSQLIVKSFKPPEVRKEFEEVKSAPIFKELFSDRSAFENTATKFECIVTGKPTPKVRWFFNDEPVAGKDFLISTSGERQVLNIPDVAKSNEGKISCVAENEVGKATCSAKLTVQPTSLITLPDGSQSTDIQQHSETSYSLKKEVVVESSTTSTSKIISNSFTSEPQVQVHSYTAHDERSFKQVNQQPPEIKETHKVQEFHQVDHGAPVIQEKTVSTISLGGDQAIAYKPVIRHRPPKFVTPVVGKIVDQGVDVILEGILDGQPTPTVTWAKNGSELKPSENIKLTFELNRARVEIKNVTIDDAGRYTCTANNEAGTAVSTSDLVVRKTVFPPVFGRRLQAQVVKKGDRVRMEVEVTGTPEPTVTWFKDDIPIEVALKGSHRILTQGISHVLIIENVNLQHTGKYMARAVNSGGEAQSIADFAVFEPTPDTMVEVVKTVVFEDVQKHQTLTSAADQRKTTLSTTQQTPLQVTKPKPIFTEPLPLIKSSESQFSQSLSSKSEFSTVSQTHISQESKTLKLERSVPELPKPIEITKFITSQHTQTRDVPIILEQTKAVTVESGINTEKQPTIDDTTQTLFKSEVETEDTGIQTTSISKQASLDYFVQKLKETEAPAKPREITKGTPLQADIYTKFEDASQKSEIKYEPPKPTLFSQPITPQQKIITHQIFTDTFSSQRSGDFGLTPEPPPEICYAPRSDISMVHEEISTKAKRLQESQKELSPLEIPLGAVKIFPTPLSKPVEEIHEPIPIPTVKKTKEIFEQKIIAETPTFFKKELPPPVYRPQADILTRPLSPRPSAEALEMEKLWLPQKPETERPASAMSFSTMEKQTIPRPLSALSSASQEPSAEAIAMEKSWAHKSSETHFEKSWPPAAEQKSWPPAAEQKPWSPAAEQKSWPPAAEQKSWPPAAEQKSWPPAADQQSWSVQSTLEKKWTPIQTKTESYTKEFKTFSDHAPAPRNYVANVTDVHREEFAQSSYSKTEISTSEAHHESVIEERVMKPSEIIKSWPPLPKEEYQVKPPPLKPTVPLVDSLTIRPVSVQDITDEVYLQPGSPPEIAYAQPPRERKPSLVETIEHDLEKNLVKEPSRVLPGSVRTIPPPLPPKNEQLQAPPLPAKPIKRVEAPKKIVETKKKQFEKFPELEPFPFKADPLKSKPAKAAPPPTPSKFIKGRFVDSDYESDFEAMRITPKWKPCVSDNEEPSFRKVRPPQFSPTGRSRSVEPEPLPPSKFEQPLNIQGPIRPVFTSESKTLYRKEAPQQVKKQVKQFTRFQEVKRPVSPPTIKPGTPPEFVQAEPIPKPESPKFKHKPVIDGYMADTDEPFTLQKKSKSEYRQEHSSKTEYKRTFQSFETSTESSQQKFAVETHTAPKPIAPPKVYKKHVASSAASKKELVTTPIITSVSMTEKVIQRDERDSTLEQFPFKPEPPRTKKTKGPPPPSPSKFVKGEFRESDYESDYEGRIPPVWRASDLNTEPAYKPVRPVLTPSGRHSQQSVRTPTPPTEFDHPPQISGPPRPKFEPIEKPKQTVKLNEILKSTEKTQFVHKPTPVSAKPTKILDVIVATPAISRRDMILQPGSPPEIAYASSPKVTQYYRSTTSAPYHNAVQTETSNVMHFNESTEHSHRTVSVQQSKKVITFGGQTQKQEQSLEPFPFKPEPERPRRSSAPPPPKPKKFVPGEFRESDYESEVEGAKIKPLWTPGDSDTDGHHYRKVPVPHASRSSSVPAPHQRVVTPMEFDTYPPYMPSSKSVVDGESRRHMTDIRKRFGETKSSQMVQHVKAPSAIGLHPGSPPEYGYVPDTITKSTATKIASQHMEDMTQSFKSKTQQFVSDIMSDVKKKPAQAIAPQKPADGDAQVYREETRAAQYGTKHVDPDTGLIYFKYDFGYEFGIILPGEGKSGEIPVPKKTVIEPPKRSFDIEMPVYHESSKPTQNSNATTPQFRPKKFTAPTKNVRWEPTSESEMSEYEGDASRKRPHFQGSRWDQSSTSPVYSISPSLPSTSPAFNNYTGPAPWTPPHISGAETPVSSPSTPGSTTGGYTSQNAAPPKRAPLFITPLRDIAVVSGQAARFECIVQSETSPSVLWSKNGRIIENSKDYQIHYRNGVCRLTIPQAFPEDAGTYTCTATNQVGAGGTTATLQVPGERRSQYIK